MTSDTQRLFVVTGGPGSGKTTLIDALAQGGCARSIEAGRGVIQDQVAIRGPALPWRVKRCGLFGEKCASLARGAASACRVPLSTAG